MRIRTKLAFVLLTLPLMVLAIDTLLVDRSVRDAMESGVGRRFELDAAHSMEVLDRELLSVSRTAEMWAGLERLQATEKGDPDGRIASFLAARAGEDPRLRRAVVTDAAGSVVAAAGAAGRRLAPEAVARARGDLHGPCGDDPAHAGAALACSFPIKAHGREDWSLGTLQVSWDLVSALESERSLHSSPDGGTLVLLRRDGSVVSSRGGHADAAVAFAGGSTAAALARAGRQGHLVEPLAGQRHLVGYAHSSGPSGWSVLVLQPTNDAFAPLSRVLVAVTRFGVGVAVVALALSLLLAARLTRPIRELERAAVQVAGGDLGVRLEPRSLDEIGSLTRSFDSMVRELARQRAQLVDKQYVDSLIAGMSDGLLVVAPDGHVERANPALLRLVGRTGEAVIGGPAGALFVEGEEVLRKRLLGPTGCSGMVKEVELTLAAADGSLVPVIVSAGRLPPAGPVGCSDVVCITTDITRRKLAEVELSRAREAAEAAAQAKSSFLATVSHEVCTPLNGIVGLTELLEVTPLDARQREYVSTLRHSSEALAAVLNDMLDYSRIGAGRLQIERVAFDLRDCVEHAADVLAVSAHQKNLELCVDLDESLARRVVGDPNRLRQVLLGLGGNAVKFTAAGSVVLRAQRLAARRLEVRFCVQDTGPGIPASDRERIFEPFLQLDASATRSHGGVGLGLAIARELVALMGGRLEVESQEGRGTTFSFTIELPELPEERSASVADLGAFSGLRVLVVDDNAVNRLVLRDVLLRWGCLVDEAADAWEALEKLRAAGATSPFDIALVDYQMPEMDGAALAREIKQDKGLGGIALILLSSMPQHGEAARASDAIFAAQVAKPIRQAVLQETMSLALRQAAGRGRPHLALVPPAAPGLRPRGAAQ